MKKKALYKSIFREIRSSKARFFSILGIILLGVCFYAGIKATGPNMLKTADKYYTDQQLMDQHIVSTLGLDKADEEIIKKIPEVKEYSFEYTKDLSVASVNRVIKFQSLMDEKNKGLNKYRIMSGRLPEQDGEVALDDLARLLGDYQLGDKVVLNDDDGTTDAIKFKELKVVGFVNSPLYVENASRGNTTVGKGAVDYFAVLPKTSFSMENYTDLFVRYRDTDKKKAYSDDYDKEFKSAQKIIKKQFSKRPAERLKEVKSKVEKPLLDNQKKVDKGKKDLSDAKSKVAEGESILKQLKASGLPDTAIQLVSLEKNLAKNKEVIAREEKKIVKAEKSLDENQKKLDEMKEPDYFFWTRDENPGYTEYQENAKRISSIATIFPVFFFLIAALVSLTTMTRMVDEKRGEIGTLKALGYRNHEIALKYIVYATLASLIGSGLGLVIGFNIFPKVIIDAYGALYNLPSAEVTYYLGYSIQSVCVALICTLVSSLLVLRYDLFSSPASLMRPKAPKAGQRILLERLSFIWRRFNFNQKVTARNLFRYKQRMFMTIFGIAGCMALIITGFGLRDSISDIVSLQFNKLWHYQGIVSYAENPSKKAAEELEQTLADLPEISDRLIVSQQSFEAKKEGIATQKVTLDVPKELSKIPEFMLFNDRLSGETYTLGNKGVIVNEKLAKMLGLKAGDTLELSDSKNKRYPLKIQAVVENYAMHFVYISPEYYTEVFGKKPVYNSELLLFKEEPTQKMEDNVSETLMKNEKVVNVSFLSQTSSAMDDTISSLNVVVWVLIISAALLAFIVLYNLTNINISERIRELSTIKVLGFYNKEVTMYVYRENNILTILGIAVGCLVGKLLHGFVLNTAEVDMVMFSPTIHVISYVYSALLTLLFSTLVMWAMHRKLKHVDMIEALKSTE